MHIKMDIKWEELHLEVRLADETLECPQTDISSLLGHSLMRACKVDPFLGEMFNLSVHML